MPLRLGVACVVCDDAGRVLLSRRGDFNTWTLPGGRLDAGETLAAAAAREVREETGIVAHVERVVGLYYAAGWNRLTVLYAGWPLGGSLRQRTAEARANAFFAPDALPSLWRPELLHDALADTRPPPRVLETAPAAIRRARRRLAWRWIVNLLRGRPEPRFVRFQVRAVGVIWDETFRRVLTLPGQRGRVLPRVVCDGERAPWDALAGQLRQQYGLALRLGSAGIWQDVAHDRVELVFAASLPEKNLTGAAEWSTAQHAALGDRDRGYIERVRPAFATSPIWTMINDGELGDTALYMPGGAGG
jgi:ADP-ribose pyrophosphatase YjhB (NUDIX family)